MVSNIIEKLNSFNLEKTVFRIPLYQRPYNWEDIEVEQLLMDLENSSENYFVGNIVLSQAETKGDSVIYDVIDGQQRLTTLFLISTLTEKNKFSKLNILYEIRENDQSFLEELRVKKGKYEECSKELNSNKQFIININAINRFLNKHENKHEYLNELLEKVQLVFTKLPKKTDITKYFEIMNNRGRQLEKHQILKAKFLKGIDKEEKKYATIWDVCSKMDIYVVDYLSKSKKISKKSELVEKLFTNIKEEDLAKNIFEYFEDTSRAIKSLNDILNEPSNEKEIYYDEFEHYNSIIKFPIFLLHCLKLYLLKNKKDSYEKIFLDDNKLIEEFKKYFFNETEKIEEKKIFITFMFKQRILFDFFIFKRDNSENKKPFLKEIKSDFTIKDENVNILMIQLLFNFSSNFYVQDWLSVTLKWLNENISKDIDNFYKKYLSFLESFDRNLAKSRIKNESLTNSINSYLKTGKFEEALIKDEEINFLNSGTSTPHYWFYRLDYLLWKNYKNIQFGSNFDKSKFRLTRLNSIEHIYPQQPLEPKKEWSNSQKLDNFGNLALISNHMNSSLSNKDYKKEKKGLLTIQLNKGTIESLKMILLYSKYDEWTPENCEHHQKEMIELLIGDLNNAK